MAEYATKQDVQNIVDKAIERLVEVTDQRINALTGEITGMFADLIQYMDNRFDRLETRMERMEHLQEKQAKSSLI